MANITAADVKKLRDATGAGMMDCKKALEETGGDFDAAVEALRLKGVKDIGKRQGRTAANGLVTSALAGTSTGVLLELNCETDFVAKTELFQQVAADIVAAAREHKPADRLAVLGLEVAPGVTAQQRIDEAGASLKEKVELGRYALFDGGYVASYLHRSDRALPPTVGVLVQLDGPAEQAARDLAHQVAAMRPQYVSRDDVPADVVARERSLMEEMTRQEGKPEQAVSKIVEGRLNAFFADVVLTEQPFVRDPKKKIRQLLSEAGATVLAFARFQVGQAG
jgi:elongation factor Ts